MASNTAEIAAESRSKQAGRHFFSVYSICLVLLAFGGFARTFYLSWVFPLLDPPFPLETVTVAHGIAATAFILLFPIQAWLISADNRRLHMTLGKAGLALGALLLVLIYLTAANSFHAPGPADFPSRAAGAMLPISLIPLLALFLWLGWRNRRNADAHKRWIILAGCALVAPAVARIPIMSLVFPGNGLLGFAVGTQLLMFSTVVPLWIRDRRSLGRIHPATKWGSLLFFLVLALRLPAAVVIGPAVVAALPGFGMP
jgi:hypothetical protein